MDEKQAASPSPQRVWNRAPSEGKLCERRLAVESLVDEDGGPSIFSIVPVIGSSPSPICPRAWPNPEWPAKRQRVTPSLCQSSSTVQIGSLLMTHRLTPARPLGIDGNCKPPFPLAGV
jgi:hypothetical protein